MPDRPVRLGLSAAGARLTVYWGAQDSTTSLADVCADPSYDIVNLAFLSHFFTDGGYPRLSIITLSGPSEAQSAAGATSLRGRRILVAAIEACQGAGKLVILQPRRRPGLFQLDL